MREVELVVPQIKYAAVEPGDTIYSGTGAIPTPGDAADPDGLLRIADVPEYWRERPLYVYEVDGSLMPGEPITLHCLDLRNEYCSLWWPMISELGVDENDSGIAYLDNGGGVTANRNQVGYSRRPDGLYIARAASTTAAGLRYYSYRNLGLHMSGGAEHTLLNATFSTWGGGAPTSWTRAVAGTATAAQDTTRYLVDASGLQSSIRFTNDGAGANSYVYQASATWTAAHYGRVRLSFELGSVSAPIQVLLRRSDGADYNFSTLAWVGGSPGLWANPLAVGSVMDSDATLANEIIEWQSPVFAAGGNYDMTLYVGNMTGASAVATCYYAQLVRSTAVSVPAWQVIPTVGAAITALGDLVTISNATSYRMLMEDRGTVEIRWRPSFNHSDLADASYKFLFFSYRQGTGVTNERDRLAYYRTDATNGKWVFERAIAGTSTDVEWAVSGSDLLTAGTEYKLAIRWTGSHEELWKAAYTMDLFVDGALVATGVSGAPNAADNNAVVLLANSAAGAASQCGAGWYNRLTVQTWCKTDAEILRGMVD